MNDQDRCFLYSANGQGYIAEALQASSITKAYCTNIPITLCADRKLPPGPNAFDRTIIRNGTETENAQRFLFKIRSILGAKIERTIFLDTDAACVSDRAESLFRLLNHFDIAVAHARTRTVGQAIREIPRCFPEFNTGVIAFRNTKKVKDVLRRWEDLYRSRWIDHPHDQGAFRYALYFSGLRIATLPPEYNNRTENKGNCIIWHSRRLFRYFNLAR